MYRRVDAARFPGMDAALRMALNSGLEEKLDYEVLRGSRGTSDRLEANSLITINLARPLMPSISLSSASRSVDGRYASEQSDLRVLMGSGTYAHAGSTYQTNPHLSALDALMAKVPVRVSAHVPDVASTKQNNVIRLGSRIDYVQPLWNNITVIVDEVTGSGKGEIEVTAVLSDEHEDPPEQTDSSSSRHRSARRPLMADEIRCAIEVREV